MQSIPQLVHPQVTPHGLGEVARRLRGLLHPALHRRDRSTSRIGYQSAVVRGGVLTRKCFLKMARSDIHHGQPT
jgi:hypothetical protein